MKFCFQVFADLGCFLKYVTGDIPGRLVKEFSPELALPTSIIFNQILKTGNWPKSWKIETGIPLAKISEPSSESDIRIVSLTNWSSKILEKFVVEWLWGVIGEKIDPKQFGGKKKVSTVHYLIEFVTFCMIGTFSRVMQLWLHYSIFQKYSIV